MVVLRWPKSPHIMPVQPKGGACEVERWSCGGLEVAKVTKHYARAAKVHQTLCLCSETCMCVWSCGGLEVAKVHQTLCLRSETCM